MNAMDGLLKQMDYSDDYTFKPDSFFYIHERKKKLLASNYKCLNTKLIYTTTVI